MTSAHGIPIDDKLAVQTVGPRGLMLLQVHMSLGVMDVHALTLHNNVHFLCICIILCSLNSECCGYHGNLLMNLIIHSAVYSIVAL